MLQDYLNTVYFGRGAYGIEVAAQAYFGVHARNLDVALPVHNFANEQCPSCTLLAATAHSVNTVYVPLALQVGPAKVAALAHKAGISQHIRLADKAGNTGAGIALGIYGVRPLDQADPYLVQEVRDRYGHVVYRHRVHEQRAMSQHVADGVTHALQTVIQYGTASANAPLAGGRPAAGKTGTTENETDAWFVGYTPQLSAAVWTGYADASHKLHGVEGYPIVTGGTLPALIWKKFMDRALHGRPVERFPSYDAVRVAPPPAPTSTAPPPPSSSSPPPQPRSSPSSTG